jgi:hypothetical protein
MDLEQWKWWLGSALYYVWPVEDRIYKGRIPYGSLVITLVKAEQALCSWSLPLYNWDRQHFTTGQESFKLFISCFVWTEVRRRLSLGERNQNGCPWLNCWNLIGLQRSKEFRGRELLMPSVFLISNCPNFRQTDALRPNDSFLVSLDLKAILPA